MSSEREEMIAVLKEVIARANEDLLRQGRNEKASAFGFGCRMTAEYMLRWLGESDTGHLKPTGCLQAKEDVSTCKKCGRPKVPWITGAHTWKLACLDCEKPSEEGEG